MFERQLFVEENRKALQFNGKVAQALFFLFSVTSRPSWSIKGNVGTLMAVKANWKRISFIERRDCASQINLGGRQDEWMRRRLKVFSSARVRFVRCSLPSIRASKRNIFRVTSNEKKKVRESNITNIQCAQHISYILLCEIYFDINSRCIKIVFIFKAENWRFFISLFFLRLVWIPAWASINMIRQFDICFIYESSLFCVICGGFKNLILFWFALSLASIREGMSRVCCCCKQHEHKSCRWCRI